MIHIFHAKTKRHYTLNEWNGWWDPNIPVGEIYVVDGRNYWYHRLLDRVIRITNDAEVPKDIRALALLVS